MSKYQRSIKELQNQASIWWSKELLYEVALNSPSTLLAETFLQFYESCIQAKTVNQLIYEFESNSLPLHHNLKHLQVITDVGGEVLKRISSDSQKLFPNGKLNVCYQNAPIEITVCQSDKLFRISNPLLDLDAKGLAKESPRNPELIKATTQLLCLGKFATNYQASEILRKCGFADYIGNKAILDEYLKTRYIAVSRITTGSETNATGQILQKLVKDKLMARLKTYMNKIIISTNGILTVSDHSYTSDILVTNRFTNQSIGIEVSFQVTTNSVIERKANEAKNRFLTFTKAGNYTAYVLDGAGNFERVSACTKICESSHCTVAYSEPELDLLTEFIIESLNL